MQYYTLKEFCQQLSISTATGRNWLRMKKIVPDYVADGLPRFSAAYTIQYQKKLSSGSIPALHSRRNKSYCSGHSLYSLYVGEASPNLSSVHLAVSLFDTSRQTELIPALLAECALQLLASAGVSPYLTLLPCNANTGRQESFLAAYLQSPSSFLELYPLIHALIPNSSQVQALIAEYPTLFSLPFTYCFGEDTLGFLYLSLRSLQTRKQSGAYFTPKAIVDRLISSLDFDGFSSCAVLDPGCGSGNFLLSLPPSVPLGSIFGTDLDAISVSLTRINLLLREMSRVPDDLPLRRSFFDHAVSLLLSNIRVENFLLAKQVRTYTHILGNPPWGYSFSAQEAERLKPLFACMKQGKAESYDLFLEQSVSLLQPNGILSFVLPEALLFVRAHSAIRSLLCHTCSFTALTCLGDCFPGVQCPSIILTLTRQNPGSCIGMHVSTLGKSFTIQQERTIGSEAFSFLADDIEYAILQKLLHVPNVRFLAGHADFALGIVTGNNKEFIQKKETTIVEYIAQNKESSVILPRDILCGTDLTPYHLALPSHVLCRPLSDCQQAAPDTLYEAPEKLVYRFISEIPVFACDRNQTMLLNSCNLVIPHMEGLEIQYILAVLNSRITQFFYRNSFHSVKVLRSHLEQLPIPLPSDREQSLVTALVSQIESVPYGSKEYCRLYEQLERQLATLFLLSDEEYATICKSLR